MTPDRQTIRNRVRRLDSDAFVGFVAAVWRARGWRVERTGGRLVARTDERTKRIVPAPVDRFGRPTLVADADADAVDVVVTAGDETTVPGDLAGAATVVDGDALVDMFLYGIDSTDTDRIARRYFGGSVAAVRPPLWRRLGQQVGTLLAPRTLGLALGLAVVLLAGAGAFQVAIAGDSIGDEPPDTSTPAGPSPRLTGTPMVDVPAVRADVPGFRSGGSVDVDSLLGAHSRQLSGRSYRIRRSYRGPPANGATTQTVLRSRTLATTPIRTLVEVRSTWTNGSQIGTEDLYMDGSHWYRATFRNGSFVYENVSDGEQDLIVIKRGEYFLERYLSTNGSLVVDERIETEAGVRYRIVGHGAPTTPPFSNATNYTVTAVVGPEGIVRRLNATYVRSVDGTDASVSVDWRLTLDENLIIEPPRWYREEFTRPPNR